MKPGILECNVQPMKINGAAAGIMELNDV